MNPTAYPTHRVLPTITVVALLSATLVCLETSGSAQAADANPTLVGNLDIPQPVARVAVSGTYALVTSGFDFSRGSLGALHIVDVADPAQPIWLGTFELTRPAWGVAASGDYAYVANEAAGLVIVNLSDPTSPVRVGEFNTSESACDVCLVDHLAYVADGQAGLVIIDVSNPASPQRVGGLDALGEAQQVVVSGNYAYLADRFWNGVAEMQPYGALRIVDISDLANPKLVGQNQTEGQAWSVAVAGHFAYVGADALEVFDVSDPVNPRRIGSYSPGGAVAVEGHRAFIANFQSGLHVLDIFDPTLPHALGTTSCAGYPRGLAVAGRLAYVSAQTYNPNATGVGLQIFDVGLPVQESLPPLVIELSGRNTVISWPASASGATLETTDTVDSAASWILEPTAPVRNGEQHVVTLDTSRGTKFFRLKKP
jgi:hypothetical protein